MNKKGFTLIELLAVILILGIIALIAIPSVTGIIAESKVGAWKSTANQIVNSYEQYAQLQEVRGATVVTDMKNSTTIAADLKIKGNIPTEYEVLALDSNKNAVVGFHVSADNVYCWNYSGNYAGYTTSRTLTDMYCNQTGTRE